jgi:oxygen-independent coproporphyrinogen III oxidase
LESQGIDAVRFATPDSLEQWSVVSGQSSADGSAAVTSAARAQQLKSSRTLVDAQAALEESFFLGLRLNRGISLQQLGDGVSEDAIESCRPIVAELVSAGLLEMAADRLRLTPRGRLLSNEVFGRFLNIANCGTTPA